MKIKLLLCLMLTLQFSFAQQRTCGVKEATERMYFTPALKAQQDKTQQNFEIELEKLKAQQASGSKATNATIYIPVAVHYPSSGSATAAVKTCLRNLAQSQINTLNADYNATNTDITLWEQARSNYPGVNVGSLDVQFVIATQNHPASSGLVNGNLAVTFGTNFLNGEDRDIAWKGYMNLVVRDIEGGILGYSPLGGSPRLGMTVVIDNNAFGKGSGCSGYPLQNPYNLGRTLTHELGHFFNLEHTFNACDGTNCANSGDRVCDTPPTNAAYYRCSPPGSVESNCYSGPVLTMNYMDYVSDSCMYMFTAGQATRMKAYYNSISSQFLTNTLGNNDFVENNFLIYPNPNNGTFMIELKEALNDYSIQVFDTSGRVIVDNEYIQNSSLSQTIKLDNSLAGIYFITIKTAEGGVINKKIIVK